uniref:Uncharacterized protein n=1 Tax=Cacopsylla melanoneura TaxID=428564 RepID=A0A8D8ZAA7_9HEMI
MKTKFISMSEINYCFCNLPTLESPVVSKRVFETIVNSLDMSEMIRNSNSRVITKFLLVIEVFSIRPGFVQHVYTCIPMHVNIKCCVELIIIKCLIEKYFKLNPSTLNLL